MKCPACGHSLLQTKIGSVTIDACNGGCGGIWLDKLELSKINKENPSGPTVLDLLKNPDCEVDESAVRQCPRCKNEKLERRLFSLGTGVEMDCCGKCGGFWLDHGELKVIREETNPVRRPTRAVRRIPQKIQINFAVIRQVEQLSVQRIRSR